MLEQARRFLEIRWLSAPAALANLVLLGWLLGVQYVRAPVILLIVGNLLNIVLDIWLVMGLGWNVRGAAAATAIAEYATLLLGLWLAWRVMRLRGITLPMLRQAWRGDLRRLLALNRDIMLRSLLLQLCFASLTIFGARLGSDVVAVNAVLMNLLTFTAYALDGFAYAVEAHSGHAYGARDDSQLRKVWHAACRQAGLVALAFALAYAVTGQQIVAALTSLPELRALAAHYLPWQVILPLVGVWCYLLDGMFIGATRGAEMRNRHGSGRGRIRSGAVQRAAAWQPRALAGVGGVFGAARSGAGLDLAPPSGARQLVYRTLNRALCWVNN